MFQHTPPDNTAGQVHNDLRRRLNNCGIGFTGVDGVSWRPVACGSHITVSEGNAAVAEGINAVQAPTVFV
jgi:hypothetical protein